MAAASSGCQSAALHVDTLCDLGSAIRDQSDLDEEPGCSSGASAAVSTCGNTPTITTAGLCHVTIRLGTTSLGQTSAAHPECKQLDGISF